MRSITERIQVDTAGRVDVVDISSHVRKLLADSKLKEGLATVFVPGSTATVTTIEYEPGLVADLTKALERIAPQNINYAHNQRWHDDNGHSHIRASFLKPSVTVPFSNNTLMLGTWQQLVFIELDVRPRNRTIIVQFIGD
jgi:secondary thiamine-phosphate synthase enzyme